MNELFLTPKDIHDKTFKRSFKGYDENEVDEFLDLVIKEFNLLIDENERLRQELMAKPIVQDYSATSVGEIKHLEGMLAQAIEAMNKNSQILSNVNFSVGQAAPVPEELQKASEKFNKLDEFKKTLENYKSNFELLIEEQKKQLNEKYSEIIGELSAISGEDAQIPTAPHQQIVQPPSADAVSPQPPQSAPKLAPQFITQPQPIQQPGQQVPTERPSIFSNPPEQPSGMIEKTILTIEKQTQPEPIMRQPEISIRPPEREPEKPQAPAPPKYQGIVNQSAETYEQNSGMADNRFKPNYSEYAWLYQDKDLLNKTMAETANMDVSFRNPKEKEELKRLIDEVID